MSTPPAPSAEELLARLEMFGIRLGLVAFRRLLEPLGRPHLTVPSVLIAGTNGKGSTAALLAAMATAAGYRTGLYTSPHLESPRERLRIDGEAVGAARLAALLEEVLAAGRQTSEEPPTYFEAITAAAFLYFAREGVELAVLEVGLGGRLDATNAAEPILSVITRIALDHCQYLGDTLTAIAREKAGILRAGVPALALPEPAEAAASLTAEAERLGARLRLLGREETFFEEATEAGSAALTTPQGSYRLRLPLAGRHQRDNVRLAVRAAETLREGGWEKLDRAAVERGVAGCRWPGRLEAVTISWQDSPRRILLDAAHNPDGAETLLRFLLEQGRPYELLFGALEDKDAAAMLSPLAARAGRVTLTTPDNARAIPPERLRRWLPPEIAAAVEAEPAAALARALDTLAADATLVVCGSIYLLGAVREELRRRFGVPEAAAEMRLAPYS